MMVEIKSDGEFVRLAYDQIAREYDEQVAGDAWMRARLWRSYSKLFRPGDHILDVSCGTGIDAAFLARSQIHVTGIDISPAMIAQLQDRAEREQLDHLIDGRVLDHAEIGCLPPGEFDGIVSAFAGLNTS